MKANRKFIEEEDAVSAVIGVILMVAITVAIAATVYVYVSGMLGTGPATTPTVTLQQSGSFIAVLEVQNGPVTGVDCTVQFVNQTSGLTDRGNITYATAGSAVNLDGGDSITPPADADWDGSTTGPDVGEKFTVQLLYGGDVVGTAVYTVPT